MEVLNVNEGGDHGSMEGSGVYQGGQHQGGEAQAAAELVRGVKRRGSLYRRLLEWAVLMESLGKGYGHLAMVYIKPTIRLHFHAGWWFHPLFVARWSHPYLPGWSDDPLGSDVALHCA